MSLPDLVPGYKFRLRVGDGGNPEVFKFVCIATTLKLDEKVDTDDSMVQDCDYPDSLPQRVSTPKDQTWDVSFSGKCDHARYLLLRNRLNTIGNWQIEIGQPASSGGGKYQGSALLSTLSLSKSDNGMATFDATLVGQGGLDWIPAT